MEILFEACCSLSSSHVTWDTRGSGGVLKRPVVPASVLVAIADFLGGFDERIHSFLTATGSKFNFKDMGRPRMLLGLEIEHLGHHVELHQYTYAMMVLRRFGMEGCNGSQRLLRRYMRKSRGIRGRTCTFTRHISIYWRKSQPASSKLKATQDVHLERADHTRRHSTSYRLRDQGSNWSASPSH